jgi:hypothetical protein
MLLLSLIVPAAPGFHNLSSDECVRTPPCVRRKTLNHLSNHREKNVGHALRLRLRVLHPWPWKRISGAQLTAVLRMIRLAAMSGDKLEIE